MHVAAFIGELQHYKIFKLSHLSIGKWAISPFLSDQVTYGKEAVVLQKLPVGVVQCTMVHVLKHCLLHSNLFLVYPILLNAYCTICEILAILLRQEFSR